MMTPQPRVTAACLLALASLLPLSGCQSHQHVDGVGEVPGGVLGKGPGEGPGVDPELAHGYTLLHNLCRKQSRAGGAFIIVSADAQTERLIQAVADASGEMAERIKRHAEAATPPIPLKADGLPAVETDTRGTAESLTTRAILFGKNSGRTLVLAQIEATGYAASLAENLAKRETDEMMAEALRGFAATMRSRHDELVALVRIMPPSQDEGAPG